MTGTALHIEKLNKSYGDHHVLKNMSFSVQPGEIYGFVGSNGAGKSTTMRIALGVLAADSGEVRLGGTPMNDSCAAGSATCRRNAVSTTRKRSRTS